MGGSGGLGFRKHSSEEITDWLSKADDDESQIEYNAYVNEQLADRLVQYNDRDTVLTRSRLDAIQASIEDELDVSLDLRFGGSVSKHTYVNGLSDIDALFVLRDQALSESSADEVLARFTESLRAQLSYTVDISSGDLAVTVSYPDGMQIQILPAVRASSGVRIASADGSSWSSVIRPDAFASKLTEVNQTCNGRMVPVIKLAKSALADLPESLSLTGYHIESLAVRAFQRYSGPYNYKDMLHHFFERAAQVVLAPIRDRTGQSLNVDEYLGGANSAVRRAMSGRLERLARRLDNADRVRSTDDWLDAIGEASSLD